MAGAAADGREKVIAAAQHIIKSLATSPNAAEDMLRILSGFDHRLSAIPDLFRSSAARLDAAEKVILHWDASNADSLWESFPDDAAEYLAAVDEVIRLAGGGGSEDDDDLCGRAESVIQVAMARLEDEFQHLINRNSATLDANCLRDSFERFALSFPSDSGNPIAEDSDPSVGGEQHEANPEERGGNSPSDDRSSNSIPPEVISDLKHIADRMISTGYGRELCQAYIGARREILNECLSVLGVDKLSIDEVQRIKWKALDDKMKKWIRSLKIVVRVLLLKERKLCDQIFAASDELKEECFIEATKVCVMQLLNFGDAIAIGKWASEKVFRILGMYEALADVLPDLLSLLSGNSEEFIFREVEGNLGRLGDAVRGALARFGSAIQRETSRKPLQGGEIHPLTKYVMNYIRLLVGYSSSLNVLLADGGDNPVGDESMTPLSHCIYVLISDLECKLEEKSKLYEDDGMPYIFLMNNLLYMVREVKDSELKIPLGDDWVRKCRRQIRQYATSYLRASWTKVLSCLKDDGLGGSGSSHNASRVALKERFKNFNLAFEEIYRTQTKWKVPDSQLREELRISISEKVIPAYRSFVGRFHGQLEGGRHVAKYLKYTPEDIENYLVDLFEGCPSQSSHHRRKLSL
ncbi:exocyst complex component EXO70A1-like [Phoenix dactylifera]|uniref:Exocyst subunit Exo70 family protein n=1 Tax=Phoenix dactylifera TaxID=42345 RepID=A0A8B7MU73_PHODC|nr:exocyst complex component EXO70A1-like [Phoenix dactylifera]